MKVFPNAMNKVLKKRNLAYGRRTSTPIKPKGYKECYVNLSPISDGVLSQLSKDYDFDKLSCNLSGVKIWATLQENI